MAFKEAAHALGKTSLSGNIAQLGRCTQQTACGRELAQAPKGSGIPTVREVLGIAMGRGQQQTACCPQIASLIILDNQIHAPDTWTRRDFGLDWLQEGRSQHQGKMKNAACMRCVGAASARKAQQPGLTGQTCLYNLFLGALCRSHGVLKKEDCVKHMQPATSTEQRGIQKSLIWKTQAGLEAHREKSMKEMGDGGGRGGLGLRQEPLANHAL